MHIAPPFGAHITLTDWTPDTGRPQKALEPFALAMAQLAYEGGQRVPDVGLHYDTSS